MSQHKSKKGDSAEDVYLSKAPADDADDAEDEDYQPAASLPTEHQIDDEGKQFKAKKKTGPRGIWPDAAWSKLKFLALRSLKDTGTWSSNSLLQQLKEYGFNYSVAQIENKLKNERISKHSATVHPKEGGKEEDDVAEQERYEQLAKEKMAHAAKMTAAYTKLIGSKTKVSKALDEGRQAPDFEVAEHKDAPTAATQLQPATPPVSHQSHPRPPTSTNLEPPTKKVMALPTPDFTIRNKVGAGRFGDIFWIVYKQALHLIVIPSPDTTFTYELLRHQSSRCIRFDFTRKGALALLPSAVNFDGTSVDSFLQTESFWSETFYYNVLIELPDMSFPEVSKEVYRESQWKCGSVVQTLHTLVLTYTLLN